MTVMLMEHEHSCYSIVKTNPISFVVIFTTSRNYPLNRYIKQFIQLL